MPKDFVDLKEAIPSIVIDARYAGANNFVGESVDGYDAARSLMSRKGADALALVQKDLQRYQLGLKVFDAYRPQRSVDHFMRWVREPADADLKKRYYPNVAKSKLVDLGYIAEKSGHSRGSAVDLTMVDLTDPAKPKELDMGSPFDLFDPKSHAEHLGVTPEQRANRLLLRTLMERRGFQYYAEEWWHFHLADEPFPETYFDFPIK